MILNSCPNQLLWLGTLTFEGLTAAIYLVVMICVSLFFISKGIVVFFLEGKSESKKFFIVSLFTFCPAAIGFWMLDEGGQDWNKKLDEYGLYIFLTSIILSIVYLFILKK